MVSSTRQTERRRNLRLSKAGAARKRAAARSGTPAFPVHPEGYDAKAPDAKPAKTSA
jgi:hypothetical protein